MLRVSAVPDKGIFQPEIRAICPQKFGLYSLSDRNFIRLLIPVVFGSWNYFAALDQTTSWAKRMSQFSHIDKHRHKRTGLFELTLARVFEDNRLKYLLLLNHKHRKIGHHIKMICQGRPVSVAQSSHYRSRNNHAHQSRAPIAHQSVFWIA